MKKYILHNAGLLVLDGMLCIGIAVINVVLAFAMGNLSDSAVAQDLQALWQQGALAVGCLVFILILQMSEVSVRKLFTKKCIQELKEDVYHKLFHTELEDFHTKEEAYYISLFQTDVELVNRDYFSAIGMIIGLASKVVFSVLALMFVSVKIFVIFMLVSSIPPFVIGKFKKMLIGVKNGFSQKQVEYLKGIKELIQGHDTIVLFDVIETFHQRIRREDDELEKTRWKSEVCDNGVIYISQNLGMISHILCMIAATYFIVVDNMPIGILITSTQLLNFVFTPYNNMNTKLAGMKATAGIRKKFTELLQLSDAKGEQEYQEGDVVFDHVTISYDNRTIVKDFNYRFEKGKKYVILGKTGSGKTIIAKAMTHMIDVAEASTGC